MAVTQMAELNGDKPSAKYIPSNMPMDNKQILKMIKSNTEKRRTACISLVIRLFISKKYRGSFIQILAVWNYNINNQINEKLWEMKTI